MREPRAFVRTAAACVLPWALWAALPAVRWCALDWDQVAVESFVRCSLSASAMTDGCTLETEPHSHPSCAPAARPCGASAGCPLDQAREPGGTCEAGAPEAPSHARAFCLAGPNGGVATHPAAVDIGAAPGSFVAPATAAGLDRVTFIVMPRASEARARPPTAPWSRLHPVRGPPESARELRTEDEQSFVTDT